MSTVEVGDYGSLHPVGDDNCTQCWTGAPVPCQVEACVGLVHAVFGDENADCDYWLYYKCDVCGSTDGPE